MSAENIFIVGLVLAVALGIIRGYRVGFVRGVAALISLIITIIVYIILRAILASLSVGQLRNAFFSFIILAAMGTFYGILSKIIGSLKAISKLPVLNFFNRILGVFMGIIWAIILMSTAYFIIFII